MSTGSELLYKLQTYAEQDRALQASVPEAPPAIEDTLRHWIDIHAMTPETFPNVSAATWAPIGRAVAATFFENEAQEERKAQASENRRQLTLEMKDYLSAFAGKKIAVEAISKNRFSIVRCDRDDQVVYKTTATGRIPRGFGIYLPDLYIPKHFGSYYHVFALNRLTLEPQVTITIQD